MPYSTDALWVGLGVCVLVVILCAALLILNLWGEPKSPPPPPRAPETPSRAAERALTVASVLVAALAVAGLTEACHKRKAR